MNSVVLIGRLTADPELRYLPSGENTAVANFTLAVDRNYSKDVRQQMESQGKPTADFIRCTAWGRTAEIINQYVFKGDQFAVRGRIQTDRYQHKDGHMVYTTDVRVEEFDFVNGGSKDRSMNQGPAPQQGPDYPSSQDTGFDDHGIEGLQDVENDDIPF